MSVLVITETLSRKLKKSALELTSYGKKVAEQLGTTVSVLSINSDDNSELYNYGAEKIIDIQNDKLNTFNANIFADVIKQVAEKESSELVVIDSNSNGKYLAPIIAISLNAGYLSNVVALPSSTSPFIVKRKVFSNKGFVNSEINSDIKILGLSNNSYGAIENVVSGTTEQFSPSIIESKISSEKIERTTGKVTIADADIVVSGGRGLKGSENWGMIEELAEVLGAATACSKPVADLGWRPHSEHVGQTGKPVASNLYIAIGISGAIQHLAGVNSSKVKVVINTDPEAPFFKAADYGIVGDAFEVVPKLIEKLKDFKQNNI